MNRPALRMKGISYLAFFYFFQSLKNKFQHSPNSCLNSHSGKYITSSLSEIHRGKKVSVPNEFATHVKTTVYLFIKTLVYNGFPGSPVAKAPHS